MRNLFPFGAIPRLRRSWRYRIRRNRVRQRRSGFERCYRQTLDALPADTRTIFLAHLLDGTPYDDLAARLGISITDIEQHIATALVTLDRELTRCFPGHHYVPSPPKGRPPERR